MLFLAEECRFAVEERSAAGEATVNLKHLEETYVLKGKAKLQPTGSFYSVIVKESSQGDVANLPCGARSLLVESPSGHIVARGVNKFFSFNDVRTNWIDLDSTWDGSTNVLSQRKMGGFSVCLFSLDGVAVSIMSKHVLAGPHVEMAKTILNGMLSPHDQTVIAHDLFKLNATVSCECIASDLDYFHPIRESAEFDKTLVVLSIQHHSLKETALSVENVAKLAAKWKLPFAPLEKVNSGDEVRALHSRVVSSSLSIDNNGDGLSEGVVILFEREAVERDQLTWVRPLRLKLKTAKYNSLRVLRSLVRRDAACNPSLLHVVIVQWALHQKIDVVDFVSSRGVYALWEKFSEYFLQHSRQSFRGAPLSVGAALASLLERSRREAILSLAAPITLVLLCGIPGAGKTTVSRCLLNAIASSQNLPFTYCVYVGRDAIYQEVSRDECDGGSLSNHASRRIQRKVHFAMRRMIENTHQLSALSDDAKVLVVLDACNSTPGTRKAWRSSFSRCIDATVIAYLNGSSNELLSRLCSRSPHPCINGPDEAQRAFYAVSKKFVPPGNDEADVVLSFNTTQQSSTEIAQHLLCAVCSKPVRRGKQPIVLEDAASIEREVKQPSDSLFFSILNESSPSAEAVSLLNHKAKKAVTVAAMVSAPYTVLERWAASLLLTVFQSSHNGKRSLASLLPVRWLRFWQGERHVDRDPIREAQKKWLSGWLLHSQTNEVTAESFCVALRKRFPLHSSPHITLCYAHEGDDSTGLLNGCLDYFDVPPSRMVDIEIVELLMDTEAICFRVAVRGQAALRDSQWAANGGTDAPPVPLHITLSHSAKVEGAYGGSMLSKVPLWESSNAKLKAAQESSSAKRSKEKYFNFIRIPAVPPFRATALVEEP